MNRQTVIDILVAVLLVFAGYSLHDYLHTCPTPEPTKKPEYVNNVKTDVAYVPKAKKENADIELKAGAPDLTVKVNGATIAINKADDEQFIFDKNKLQLTQSTSAELNINVPIVDKTRRWSVGAGVSKDGVVGLVGFPIRDHVGGFIAGREGDMMAGVTIQF